jgi:predicted phage tail protein
MGFIMSKKGYLADGRVLSIIVGVVLVVGNLIVDATNAAGLTAIPYVLFGFSLKAIGLGMIIGGAISIRTKKQDYI